MEILSPASYAFNPHALFNEIVGLVIFVLGFVVLFRNPRAPAYVSFFIFTVTISIWLVGRSVAFHATNYDTGLFWTKLTWLGIVLISPSVYAFAVNILNLPEKRKRIFFAYLIFVPFLAAIPFNLLATTYKSPWGYYGHAEVLELPFLFVFFLQMLLVFWHYLKVLRNPALDLVKRKQIRVLFVGMLIAYLGAVDYTATFGIPLYPFGHIPLAIYAGFIAYAILRYQLFAVTPQIAAPAIITSMADALLVADSEGKVVIANEAAANMLTAGTEHGAGGVKGILGKPLSTFLPQAPQLWQEAQKASRHTTALRQGEETSLKASDGTEIPVSLSAAVIRDPHGNPIGIAVVGHDLRKTKEFIRELEEQKRALEEANRKLSERTEEAERLNKLAVGRELKMIELKEKIRELEGKGKK